MESRIIELEKRVAALESREPQNGSLHKLTIKDRNIALDGFVLKGVKSYELKASAENLTELSLKIIVSDSKLLVD